MLLLFSIYPANSKSPASKLPLETESAAGENGFRGYIQAPLAGCNQRPTPLTSEVRLVYASKFRRRSECRFCQLR
jgi:hypothetical protein